VAVAVHQALSGAQQPRRSLDERIAMRFPRFTAFQARLIARLPPTSRLRKAAFSRSAELGLAAFNRRDLDAVAAFWDPECEYCPERQWVEAGLTEASYRGLEGYRRYVSSVDQVWAGENRLTPLEVFDLGDRVLLLADGDMRAQASGVPLRQEFALLCTLKAGRPVRAQEYYNHAEAIRSAGIAQPLGARRG
jgi:ketosteroid isomerase-like protein